MPPCAADAAKRSHCGCGIKVAETADLLGFPAQGMALERIVVLID
jgi:hypothetical protein